MIVGDVGFFPFNVLEPNRINRHRWINQYNHHVETCTRILETASRCQVQQNLATLREIAKEDPLLVLPPDDYLESKGYLTQMHCALDVSLDGRWLQWIISSPLSIQSDSLMFILECSRSFTLKAPDDAREVSCDPATIGVLPGAYQAVKHVEHISMPESFIDHSCHEGDF